MGRPTGADVVGVEDQLEPATGNEVGGPPGVGGGPPNRTAGLGVGAGDHVDEQRHITPSHSTSWADVAAAPAVNTRCPGSGRSVARPGTWPAPHAVDGVVRRVPAGPFELAGRRRPVAPPRPSSLGDDAAQRHQVIGREHVAAIVSTLPRARLDADVPPTRRPDRWRRSRVPRRAPPRHAHDAARRRESSCRRRGVHLLADRWLGPRDHLRPGRVKARKRWLRSTARRWCQVDGGRWLDARGRRRARHRRRRASPPRSPATRSRYRQPGERPDRVAIEIAVDRRPRPRVSVSRASPRASNGPAV